MRSIRDYNGEILLCRVCWQPCYQITAEEGGEAIGAYSHFIEQWDYIVCPHFPLASPLGGELSGQALEEIRQKYGTESPYKRAMG